MRIGCSVISFGNRPIGRSFQLIAELGFTVVDIAAMPSYPEQRELTDPSAQQIDDLAALVHRHGFEVAGLQSAPWAPDAIDDVTECARRYNVAASIAAAVGARTWVIDALVGTDVRKERRKGLDRFARVTAMAAEIAESRGLRLAVETPHSGGLAEKLPQVLELLDVADLPQLGIDLDTSHLLNSGSTTSEVLAAVGPRIAHVALRDGRDGEFCTPGDGDFDFGEFFALLTAAGYGGDVMLELEPPDADASDDDRVREARRARDHVAPLLELAGAARPAGGG